MRENFTQSTTRFIVLFFLLVCLLPGMSRGQGLANYTFSSQSSTFTPITGTAVPEFADDDVNSNAAIQLGFTFVFGGNNYTQVWANTNGWLSFVATPTTSGTDMRTNNLSTTNSGLHPLLAGFWDDLNGDPADVSGSTPSAAYTTTGSNGSRVFTFQWLNFVRYSTSVNPSQISLQIKLYEGSNTIEFIYRKEAGTTPTPDGTIGISFSSTDYMSLDGSGAAPNVSRTTSTNTISSFPATGQKYVFTNGTVTPPPNPGGNTMLPIANFAYRENVDTAWINSYYNFVNTSVNVGRSYWRASNMGAPTKCRPGVGCFHDTTSYNFITQFTNPGHYTVDLVVANGTGGWDSITKNIYVDTPSRKPVADFYFDKNEMGLTERVNAHDISQFGPTKWEWKLNPECYNCNDQNQLFNVFERQAGVSGTDVPHPQFYAREGGVFDVCLKVWNDRGVDSICKTQYVKVIHGVLMCDGTTIKDTHKEGYLYDLGASNNYSAMVVQQCQGGFLIDPCATKVTLNIEQFRLRNVDNLIIRDGGPTGNLLATLSGANLAADKRRYECLTGRAFLTMTTGPATSIAEGDSGFVIRWTSDPANYPLPNPGFTAPDQVYSGTQVNYINTTTGQGEITYNWDTDGNGNFDAVTTNASHTFSTLAPVDYVIRLLATNCTGQVQFSKVIKVLPITTAPLANFSAQSTEGFATDAFKLFDNSLNGVTQRTWSFTPNDVVYLSGTNKNSEKPVVRLPSVGKYTVQLLVKNSFGSDSIIKTSYLNVLAYAAPYTENVLPLSSDVGISRVVFADIDTSTAVNAPVYLDLHEKKEATLYRGVNYAVRAYRNATTNPMTRRIWVDMNLDGNFYGQDEQIASEENAKTLYLAGSFQIPNNVDPGRLTRLRVGVSLGSSDLTPDKATAGCFEDYGIKIGEDLTKPEIELLGPALYRVELNKPYTEPGVKATDNREGNISDRYEREGTVNTAAVGYYKLKYFVRDLYNNVSDTVERVVQVELNQTGPVITLNGNDTTYVEAFESFTDPGATATDNNGNDITAKMTVSGTVNVNLLGEYPITYWVRDAFNFEKTRTRIVIVRDTKAPTITTIYGGPYIKHQVNTPYTDMQIILDDNYYPIDQLTVNRQGSINTNIAGRQYQLVYTISDPSGNVSAPYIVWVTVQDTIKPFVALKGSNPHLIDVFAKSIDDPGVDYSDNYYDKSTLFYTAYVNVDVTKLGKNNTITYVVKDGAGNETRIVRDVHVVDRERPRIKIQGGTTITMLRGELYVERGVQLEDNYNSQEELEKRLEVTTTLEDDPRGGWSSSLGGWKEVTYVVTDESGNRSDAVTRNIEVGTTSLEEHNESSGISVYPNPASNELFIKINDVAAGKPVNVIVYNMLGAQVSGSVIASGSDVTMLNTSDLKDGVYLIKLSYENRVALYKLNIVR